jgi:DNA-binding MarR family transcriptional regulator
MVTTRSIRRSVSLPPRVARRVKAIVTAERTSENRVLVDLIESGLAARENEKARFFELADRLTQAKGARERAQIKEALARLTFGE